jgi:hypothetical protein
MTLKSAGKELTISFEYLLNFAVPTAPPPNVPGQGESKVTFSTVDTVPLFE